MGFWGGVFYVCLQGDGVSGWKGVGRDVNKLIRKEIRN